VTYIAPQSGPTGSENSVSIVGSFPEEVNVWFGDQAGTVHYQSPTWLVVATPAGASPGTVDLSLRNQASGTVLTVPDAYTFYAPSGGSPGGGTTTTPATSAPTTAPASTSTSAGGAGPTPGPTSTSAPTPTSAPTTVALTTTTVDPTSITTEPAVPVRPRSALLGSPVDLGQGLRGVPLGGLDDMNGMPRCTSDPCRTRTL
jgi:hypothetical protein